MRVVRNRFARFLRHRRYWSVSVSFQLRNNVAVHLSAFAIDRALQLQTRAMIRRKLCGNDLAVIRGIVPPLGVFFGKRQQLLSTLVQRILLGQVPEKRTSVSPNSDFAMFKKEHVGGGIRTHFNDRSTAQQALRLAVSHQRRGMLRVAVNPWFFASESARAGLRLSAGVCRAPGRALPRVKRRH